MLPVAKVQFQYHHELTSQRKHPELDLKKIFRSEYQKLFRNNDVHEMFNEVTNKQLEKLTQIRRNFGHKF